MQEKKIHEGRNVKRFRELLGIKQEALAYELGEDWNEKKISNTFGEHDIGNQRNDNCSFNTLDKMVGLYERMLQQQKYTD